MTAIKLIEAVKAILLDIEGTTTPIDFVYLALYPYARQQVSNYLTLHLSEDHVQKDLAGLRAEHAADTAHGLNPPPLNDSAVSYIYWLMDRDRKSTPLKSLQGKIWEEGYSTGELKSEIFADVPRALERWNRQGRRVCIYSSGSVLAQKLLFAHTSAGDLTGLIDSYFDTRIGAKKEAESYRRIAGELNLRAPEIVFISDVIAELEAAQHAGMQTVLSVRPGNPHQDPSGQIARVTTFDDILK